MNYYEALIIIKNTFMTDMFTLLFYYIQEYFMNMRIIIVWFPWYDFLASTSQSSSYSRLDSNGSTLVTSNVL